MRRRANIAFAIFGLSACSAPPPAAVPGHATELAGRVAGPPQHCVVIEPDIALRVADGDRTTLLYGSGRRIWANHLPAGCGLNQGDILVVQPIGSDYCRGDLIHSVDPVSRIPGSSCYLGDFLPYTLPRR